MKQILTFILLFLSGLIKAQALSNDDFCFANAILLGDSTNYSKPLMVDMDNDNKQDLVIYNFGNAKLQVYKNNGSDFNATPITFFIAALDIAVGDFDGDSYPDLAVLTGNNGSVTVLKNSGGTSLVYSVTIAPPSGFSASVDIVTSIYAQKLNSSSTYDDIIVFGKKISPVKPEYYILNCTGFFSFNNTNPIKTLGSLWLFPAKQLITFGDYNGDNYLDFAYSESGANTIDVELTTGNTLYNTTPANATITVTGTGCLSLHSAYYNNDTYIDIGYTSKGSSGGFFQIINNNYSGFNTAIPIATTGNNNDDDFSFQDFNNDSNDDLLSLFRGTSNVLQINEGVPTNSVSAPSYTFFAASTTTVNSNFVTADVDNNTLPDIIMTGTNSEKGRIRLIKNYSYRLNATASNNGIICSSIGVLLSATASNTIIGNFNWYNTSSTYAAVNTPTTNIIVAGNYYSVLSFTIPNSGGGCALKSNIIAIATSTGTLPTISATVTPKICRSGVVHFNDNYTSGYSYQTTSSGGFTNSNSSYTLSPISTQQYTYTVLNNSSMPACSNNFTYTIIVDTVPTINMAILPSTIICIGETATLIVSGAQTYTLGTASISGTATITPTTTGPYYNTVAGTNGVCPPSSLNITINVKPSPTISITPPTSANICGAQGLTITPHGANTYTLLPININSSSFFVDYPTIGVHTYTINGTDLNGCVNKTVNQATLSINVNVTPTISAINATICSGQTAMLSVIGASSYTWTNTGGSVISISPSITISPTNTSVFVVAGEQNGCLSSPKNTTITVNPIPNISITASTYSACPIIEVVTFTANTNNGPWNYLWSNNLGSNSVVQGTMGVTDATVTLSANNLLTGCSGNTTAIIYIKPVPQLTITPQSSIICENDSAKLTASGAVSYVWYPVSTMSFGSMYSYQITTPTTFTVIGSGINGCKNITTKTVNVYSKNNVIVTPSTNNLCVGSTIGVSVANGTITNLNNTVANPSANNSYTFHVAYGNSCKLDTIITFNVNTDCIVNPFNAFSPNGDQLNDFFYIEGINNHSNHVSIYDRWGILLFGTDDYKNVTNAWNGKHKGKDLPSGTYFYVIELKDTNETKKGWVEITGN